MKGAIAAAISGALFALGLALGGMTLPAKVVAFLDLGGDWDPSLAFVMAGAVATYALCYRLVLRRSGPIFGLRFAVPSARDIDPKLVGGAALFGIGWGLSGFCPGPALTSAGALAEAALTFTVGLIGGMALHRLYTRMQRPPLPLPAVRIDADGQRPGREAQ